MTEKNRLLTEAAEEAMKPDDTFLETELEIELILQAINKRFGYDFRQYSKTHLNRRIRRRIAMESLANPIQLLEKILYQPGFIGTILQDFSINVTSMFRDPQAYLALKEEVFPILRTYPSIRIWHAGCATGEEVYSLAILLEEEQLLGKSQIYATDFNEAVLETAKEGIFPVDKIREYSENYRQAGGQYSLSEYYAAGYGSIIFNKKLRNRISFASHNLASDSAFGEMHLILCRNVLIYFSKELQNRVIQLFHDNLAPGGVLCLGTKESLRSSACKDGFTALKPKLKIFRKKYH